MTPAWCIEEDWLESAYGATRAAQSAALEINEKLTATHTHGGNIDGIEEAAQLSDEELRKLNAL